MEEKLFKALIGKYLNGTASKEEKDLLEEYYRRLELKGKTPLNADAKVTLRDKMLDRIQSRKSIRTDRSEAAVKKYKAGSYALALLIIIAAISGLLYFQNRPEDTVTFAQKQIADTGLIKPGGNRALLTLADGSKIILDDAKNGIIADESGIHISKTSDGQLVYTIESSTKTGQNEELLFNTIETPKGGQYRVNLPDGSKVWLNAASSLKFPARFSDRAREVELNGEAYFEVYPNKLVPFKIRSGTQAIEVIGTHFNVNAYRNEPSIKTTLLEGSVRVSDITTNVVRILKPGQESHNAGDGKLAVWPVNTEETIAWTKGEFQFNDTELIHIMRQFERWYDIDIDYRQVPKTRYNAQISRNLDLKKVLEVLEVTGRIKFQIDGKSIKIHEKNKLKGT